MKKTGIKRVAVGILIASAISGSLLYSSQFLAREGSNQKATTEKAATNKVESSTEAAATIKAAVEPTTSDAVKPKVGINVGFNDTFETLSADSEKLQITTKGTTAWTVGVGQAYEQEVSIDPEIADEFFSTPDYTKYMSGTVGRSGVKDHSLSDYWERKPGFLDPNKDTIHYDAEKHAIIFDSTTVLSITDYHMIMNITIDLGQWHRDTNRLVERKDTYTITSRTGETDFLSNSGKGKIVGAISSANILDSWIENPVEQTSLITYEGQSFFGNGKQDLVNEHDTDYSIELLVNGQVYRTDYPMDANGDWKFDFGSYLKDGDLVTARVKGTEKGDNNNGVKDVKYSKVTSHTMGDVIPWENWKVNAPVINQGYSGEYMVTGLTPNQNQQNNRSYTLVMEINGTEVYRLDNASDDSSLVLPYPQGLKAGDVVTSYIIGHEKDQADKISDKTTMTVEESESENFDKWQVLPATIDTAKEGDTVIKGQVPTESHAYERTYDLEVYVNNQLVKTETGIDATLRPYDYSIDVPSLNLDDEIMVKVIGYQDLGSGSDVETKSKSAEATATVIDGTDYAGWKVNTPTLNPVGDADTTITGNSGDQNTDFGRTYDAEVLLNGTSIGTTTVGANQEINFPLPAGTSLTVGDTVELQMIGHQPNKADKLSDKATQVVTDSSHYDEWQVNPATVNDLYTTDRAVTGHVAAENTDFNRTYDLAVTVNGTEVAKATVQSDSDYSIALPDAVILNENDAVDVQVIGHQNAHTDKESTETETIVKKKVAPTTSKFEKGYWQKFGLVYEGQINNDDWDLTNKASIKKTATIVNADTGQKVADATAANTDWYEAGTFNGYQIIVSNDVLGALPAGNYIIHMAVEINGQLVGETNLTLTQLISRMGPIHDNYADMEQVVLKENTVQPTILGDNPGFTITKTAADAELKLFNKYWNDKGELIFDGYLKAATDLAGTTKKLQIKDASDTIVYEKANLKSAPASWGVPTGVADKDTFQAIIPSNYSNQATYHYALVVTDAAGQEVINTNLN